MTEREFIKILLFQIIFAFGLPRWLRGKVSASSAGDIEDVSSVPGLGRYPGKGNEWQPTPVFLLEEFHEQRSLVGYSLWGLKESDMTINAPTPPQNCSIKYVHLTTDVCI